VARTKLLSAQGRRWLRAVPSVPTAAFRTGERPLPRSVWPTRTRSVWPTPCGSYRPARYTLDSSFCVEALHDAFARFGTPEIFNTDQGSQFTAEAFTSVLRQRGVRISMDGKGRCIDNIFVERLWRSLKYEHVYQHVYDDLAEARASIGRYFEFYNHERPHQALGCSTPDVFYRERGEAA
jgi:transposase InsO family protein